jgi:hypothetical protein
VEFTPDPDKTEAENIEPLKLYIRNTEATFHIQWERETVRDEVLLKNGFMLDYTLTPPFGLALARVVDENFLRKLSTGLGDLLSGLATGGSFWTTLLKVVGFSVAGGIGVGSIGGAGSSAASAIGRATGGPIWPRNTYKVHKVN